MKIDYDKFLFMYEAEDFSPISGTRQSGLLDLLTLIENDAKIKDIRWAAYMLATVLRECGGEWKPIEEYGRGKGRPYGKPTGPYRLCYHGRGFTQTTWLDNYKMLTDAWTGAHPETPVDFVQHPGLLCIPDYAYWAMSYAMRNGTYTGVGLAKYINSEKCDYFNARKIINSLDVAQLIADNAVKFERMLRECALADTQKLHS